VAVEASQTPQNLLVNGIVDAATVGAWGAHRAFKIDYRSEGRAIMPPKLKQYLNRTILVSIPALFEDGKCRAYTLHTIEADGLWLSSNTLADRLLPKHKEKTAAAKQLVFVPSAQIAAIVLPQPSAQAQPAAAPATTQSVVAAKPAAPRGKTASAATAAPTPKATATRTK
jgi:hypothetical protein